MKVKTDKREEKIQEIIQAKGNEKIDRLSNRRQKGRVNYESGQITSLDTLGKKMPIIGHQVDSRPVLQLGGIENDTC